MALQVVKKERKALRRNIREAIDLVEDARVRVAPRAIESHLYSLDTGMEVGMAMQGILR